MTWKRVLLIPFGFYRGEGPATPPANEIWVGRERERARLLDRLFHGGGRGTYLITGQRGAGKTSFVDYCLREYERSAHGRFLRARAGPLGWLDHLVVIGTGMSLIGCGLVLSGVQSMLLEAIHSGTTLTARVAVLLLTVPLLLPIWLAKDLFAVALGWMLERYEVRPWAKGRKEDSGAANGGRSAAEGATADSTSAPPPAAPQTGTDSQNRSGKAADGTASRNEEAASRSSSRHHKLAVSLLALALTIATCVWASSQVIGTRHPGLEEGLKSVGLYSYLVWPVPESAPLLILGLLFLSAQVVRSSSKSNPKPTRYPDAETARTAIDGHLVARVSGTLAIVVSLTLGWYNCALPSIEGQAAGSTSWPFVTALIASGFANLVFVWWKEPNHPRGIRFEVYLAAAGLMVLGFFLSPVHSLPWMAVAAGAFSLLVATIVALLSRSRWESFAPPIVLLLGLRAILMIWLGVYVAVPGLRTILPVLGVMADPVLVQDAETDLTVLATGTTCFWLSGSPLDASGA